MLHTQAKPRQLFVLYYRRYFPSTRKFALAKIQKAFGAFILILILHSDVCAQIASYTGTGGSSTTITGVASETVSALQKTGFGTNTACGSGGLSGMTVSTAYTAYTSSGPHVYFQITPNAGYVLNVTGYSVITRESGTGPTKARLAYSLDGGTTWVDDGTDHPQTVGASCGSLSNNFSWTGGLTLSCISSTTYGIIFAIYPYAPGGSSGTFQVNSITVNGSVVAACSPSPILGTLGVCPGSTTTLSHATAGGTWSSSNTSVATVGSGSGVVTGVSAGTSVISYAISSCCIATAVVTVNPAPSSISGAGAVCVGSTISLTDATSGGTWSSGSTANATIDASAGIVTGVSAGTSTVTYTLSTGCIATTVVTVNALPSAISGAASVCAGSTTSLSDATPGGTWSSGTTSVATVGISSGVVSGVSMGTSQITYTLSTGCVATTVVTVNSLPLSISGITTFCVGATTSLSDASSGGTWSSGTTPVATVGISSGVVSGVSAGTSQITYTLSTGCFATTVVTVHPLPSSIAGVLSVCVGSATALTDATTGGTWSSGSLTIATAGVGTGIVGGVSAGTSDITYTLATGCLTTAVATVNSLPAAISGVASVCVGLTTSLSDPTPGGSWSSGASGIATVTLSGGVVTGVSAGTCDITYSLATGCTATIVVTVNATPGSILGTLSVCVGSVTSLSDLAAGGTWSSSDLSIATAGMSSGIVSGVSSGTAAITYILGTGCLISSVVTVNALPAAITGAASVCVGSSISLTDPIAGGTWSSSNTLVATIVLGSGTVTGVSAGTSVISYQLPTGCVAITVMTVQPLPASISGMLAVCEMSMVTLSDITPGGTWISGNAAVASIGLTSGVVTGNTAGTATITYTLGTGCVATAVVTVNPLPASISGMASVCVGSSIAMSDATAGGAWSSSNTSIATASSGGIVGGVAAGLPVIDYTLTTGCMATLVVTVNPLPFPITGATGVCQGSTTALTDAGGGSWSSSNLSIATVDLVSGIVSGITPGTSIISYTLPTGCITTVAVVVYSLPAAVGGSTSVCVGNSVTLNDATSGGTWASSNTSVATINSTTGVVTGISAGTSIVTYMLGSGCTSFVTLTVNPNPSPITGVTNVCVGLTSVLTDAGGGTWSSSNTSVASVNSAGGIVSGISSGTAAITYSLPSGCYTTATVIVFPLPSVISGPSQVCVGSSILLSDATAGGTWSGSNININVNSASGLVTGVAAGTSSVTYTMPSGCVASFAVTVNPLPAVIVGPTAVCIGATILLTDASAGGVWNSVSPSVATVGAATGIAGGVALGTTVITYVLPTGCQVTTTVSVDPTPTAILGPSVVCVGSTVMLSDLIAGGSWTSGSTIVATVDLLTGSIFGVTAGTAGITYSLGSGCTAGKVMTVLPSPSPILGGTYLCIGGVISLSDPTAGGTWISGSPGVAATTLSGTVSGISAGTSVISYVLSTGCIATAVVTVNSVPAPVSGTLRLCVGSTTSLSDLTPGGVWSSGTLSVATITLSSGVVTGIAAGTSAVTYSAGPGCVANVVVTVNPLPSSITGGGVVCAGGTVTLSDLSGGGVWSSSNPLIAAIGSSTGIVTSIAAGTATIYYALSTGCQASRTFTVNPLPTSFFGSTGLCAGQVSMLGNTIAGGTWSSTNVSVATIDVSTGTITAVASGTTLVTYTLGTGCSSSITVTVFAAPSAISGPSNVCVGSMITLSDALPGGTWASSNSSVASIGVATGILYGMSSGTVIVSYQLGSGCLAIMPVIVYPLVPINGPVTVCTGHSVVLSDTALGGTWSSSNPSVATTSYAAGSIGIVHGIAAGAVTISYTLPSGCTATYAMTVNPTPPAISGVATICSGQTTVLSDALGGGAWSSGLTAVATVTTSSGIVNGLTAGVSAISYTINGCSAIQNVTVNPLPGSISGSTNLCYGVTATLSNPVGGGTWSSSNTAVAIIDSSSGVVLGASIGTSVITYKLATGCTVTTSVVVNPFPSAILGSVNVCVLSATTLSDATPGGAWSSGNIAVAMVSGGGSVLGVNPGSAVISYTLGSGCSVTATVNVIPLPPAITGAMQVCVGAADTLSDAAGGTWSSGSVSIASVGLLTGRMIGVSPGTAMITYTLGTGCLTTATVLVNPLPLPISGSTNICVGSTTLLSDASTGGTWSSTPGSVATVDVTGLVTGLSVGTSTVTYTISTGCFVNTTVNVTPFPSSVYGSTSVCMGNVVSLSDVVPGGAWYSTNPSVAAIGSASGAVTGVAPGSAVILYTLGPGCTVTGVMTVMPLPLRFSVNGGGDYCAGGTGVHVGLSGSELGANYLLYTGSTPTGTFAGSALPLDFGLQTVGGAYHVIAISATTGCQSLMTGTVSIIVDPAVVPAVTITPGSTDTICQGTSTVFTAIPVNGGSAPAYTWKVNGTAVSVSNAYTFVPANGDVVSLTMTSNAHCASPAVASFSVAETVITHQPPLVTINASPNDTVCRGSAVMLNATAAYGGAAPQYIWLKNGVVVGSGAAPSFACLPAEGDVFTCDVMSNFFCRTNDTGYSNNVVIHVDTPRVPTVAISADPGWVVGSPDRIVTFSAAVTNGGDNPHYQWFRNGIPVTGATSATYAGSNFNPAKPDSISCDVTSGGYCNITAHGWEYIVVSSLSVQPVAVDTDIVVFPNPNKGTFTIEGNLPYLSDQEMVIELEDVLGQVVYKGTVIAANGAIKEIIRTNGIANGSYLFSISGSIGRKVFQLIIEK